MITYDNALKLIRDSLSNLQKASLLPSEVTVQEVSVLLGAGSPLDSIAFVTFVTELEDNISRKENQELYLVLQDIHEFNADNPYLSVETLARYLVKLVGEKA